LKRRSSVGTEEQTLVRTVFYKDIEQAIELIAAMTTEARDVEGIVNDLTSSVVSGGAVQSRVASLVRPLREIRTLLNKFRKTCREYEGELRKAEEEEERMREEAMEPMPDEGAESRERREAAEAAREAAAEADAQDGFEPEPEEE
jgi:hypothetical protein